MRIRHTRQRVVNDDVRAACVALAPSALVAMVFVVVPIGYSLYASLHNWSLTRGRFDFVGWKNYVEALSDPRFRAALLNTAYFSVGTVVGSTMLALGVAVLLHRGVRDLTLYRIAFLLPELTPTTVVALVWLWVFDPHYGLANKVLGSLGLPTLGWLTDPNWAMPSLILMAIWKNIGANIVIYLAALEGISREVYEASMVDGARPWSQFWFITVPLLRPVTVFTMIMGTIKSFQVFGQVYVMTQGGPVRSTMVVVYYLYEQAFESFRLGYASAVAWLLALLIFGLSWIQFRVYRWKE